MVSRTAGHILGLFLQISKLRISFTSTCQKSWRFTPEFQQHKLIQPAPEERDFSETSKVTACRGVSNDFDICRLHRLKMKTLNCWNTFLFVCFWRGLFARPEDGGRTTDSLLWPPRKAQVFTGYLALLHLSKLSRAYQQSLDTVWWKSTSDISQLHNKTDCQNAVGKKENLQIKKGNGDKNSVLQRMERLLKCTATCHALRQLSAFWCPAADHVLVPWLTALPRFGNTLSYKIQYSEIHSLLKLHFCKKKGWNLQYLRAKIISVLCAG